MAMTDSPKRKAEEAVTDAAAEPDAKKLKSTGTPDMKAVRKQVEYYMSDENLKSDKFFHDKITENGEGWLDMSLLLSCNKMKAMRCTHADVVEALKESPLELKDAGGAVRRPANSSLPALEARPGHEKKTNKHAHDGGAMVCFSGIPAEQSWVQLKEKLKETLPAKVNLWFVSEVNDKSESFVATAPFDGDAEFYDKLKLELGGATVKCELCQGDKLQQALKLLPKHIREKREKESRKRQKDRNRPIVVGTQKFLNVGALRGRVKEILNSRSDGEQLKPDGSDFKLIKALLEHHPKGAQKSGGMKGIKVNQSSQGDNRCFFMIKEDGGEEDFSAKKCLDAIEANPPYAVAEAKAPVVAAETEKKESVADGAAADPAAADSAADGAAAAPAAVDSEKKDAAEIEKKE